MSQLERRYTDTQTEINTQGCSPSLSPSSLCPSLSLISISPALACALSALAPSADGCAAVSGFALAGSCCACAACCARGSGGLGEPAAAAAEARCVGGDWEVRLAESALPARALRRVGMASYPYVDVSASLSSLSSPSSPWAAMAVLASPNKRRIPATMALIGGGVLLAGPCTPG
jgi:hypothetical protein